MKLVTADFKKKIEPNQEVIEMIEGLLDRAKSGEIEQIAVCCLGSTAYDGFWVHGDNRGWMTIGQMHFLIGEINAYITSQFIEDSEQ